LEEEDNNNNNSNSNNNNNNMRRLKNSFLLLAIFFSNKRQRLRKNRKKSNAISKPKALKNHLRSQFWMIIEKKEFLKKVYPLKYRVEHAVKLLYNELGYNEHLVIMNKMFRPK